MATTIEVEEETIISERFHSPLFLAFKCGWSRHVDGDKDSDYDYAYLHESTKDKKYKMTIAHNFREDSFRSVMWKSGLNLANFYLHNMANKEVREAGKNTKAKEFGYTGELESVRTLEAFHTFAKNKLKMLVDAEKEKLDTVGDRPDVVKLLTKNEYAFVPGVNADLDCSNGLEDAFVLYATLDLAKLFTHKTEEIKSEFWFHPDKPASYTIPELNEEHLEKDRVCCSCTDGCVSSSCECKQATHQQFAAAYPEQAALAENGWYWFGRLNLTTLAHLNAIRQCKIQIFDCCADCQCNPKTCTNSVVKRKMTNPMMILNRNRVSKERTWKPRVYTLYEVGFEFSSFV